MRSPTFLLYEIKKLAAQDFLRVIDHVILLLSVQEGWCDSVGSVEDIQAKLLKRQEAAAKRERAMAYALAHQVTHDKPQECIFHEYTITSHIIMHHLYKLRFKMGKGTRMCNRLICQNMQFEYGEMLLFAQDFGARNLKLKISCCTVFLKIEYFS